MYRTCVVKVNPKALPAVCFLPSCVTVCFLSSSIFSSIVYEKSNRAASLLFCHPYPGERGTPFKWPYRHVPPFVVWFSGRVDLNWGVHFAWLVCERVWFSGRVGLNWGVHFAWLVCERVWFSGRVGLNWGVHFAWLVCERVWFSPTIDCWTLYKFTNSGHLSVCPFEKRPDAKKNSSFF